METTKPTNMMITSILLIFSDIFDQVNGYEGRIPWIEASLQLNIPKSESLDNLNEDDHQGKVTSRHEWLN